jgi:hypothetical protein
MVIFSSALVGNACVSGNGGSDELGVSAGGEGSIRPAAVGGKWLVLVSVGAAASVGAGAKLAGWTLGDPGLLVATGSVNFGAVLSVPSAVGKSVGAAPTGLGIIPELFQPAVVDAAAAPLVEDAAVTAVVVGLLGVWLFFASLALSE